MAMSRIQSSIVSVYIVIEKCIVFCFYLHEYSFTSTVAATFHSDSFDQLVIMLPENNTLYDPIQFVYDGMVGASNGS
jgi:hypothetical protein